MTESARTPKGKFINCLSSIGGASKKCKKTNSNLKVFIVSLVKYLP